MSEPTPLSAEELAWLSNSETFRDPDARWDTAWLRSALATIAAQATEIAALKGALEEIRDNPVFGVGWSCSGSCRERARRVLAGKEAEGG